MKQYTTPEYELCIVNTTDIMSDSPAQGGLIDGGEGSPGDVFWDEA
ncbi:MAG: hypothetical protein IJZ93_01320 [Clostridia bacterium]|nr:hypothetical protein [Clostridia bacterium]